MTLTKFKYHSLNYVSVNIVLRQQNLKISFHQQTVEFGPTHIFTQIYAPGCRRSVDVQLMADTFTRPFQHTHTHPFNGPLSGTTQVSQYQKGKTNLDLTEARDNEWQWHQLGHMQKRYAHRSREIPTPASHHCFLQAGCPSCRPTNSVKALKATTLPTVLLFLAVFLKHFFFSCIQRIRRFGEMRCINRRLTFNR